MELKTLKINGDLYDKLKKYSTEYKINIQDLVENSIIDLLFDDDNSLDIEDINYSSMSKKYNLTISEKHFKNMIKVFELFLTNGNIKKISEI